MFPARYERTKPEFWLAYWYQELGDEGAAFPPEGVVTEEWWREECTVYYNNLWCALRKWVPKGDSKKENRKWLNISKGLQEWEPLGVVRDPDRFPKTGKWYDSEYEFWVDVIPWNKDMCRRIFMIRHETDLLEVKWNKSFRRFTNQSGFRLGNDCKFLWDDTTATRRDAGMLSEEFMLRSGGILDAVSFHNYH